MNVRASKMAVLCAAAAALVGCGARSSQLPAVEMRFYETPNEAAPVERIKEKFTLNATLIGDATLQYLKPSDLLKAAETRTGDGDPQKLMRAGRSLVPGDGTVLLGTVRSNESSGGSTSGLATYTVALTCAKQDLDQPGDLRDCKGYVMRVTRTWPSEVYAIDSATVSLIPEGGTAKGRVKARSVPGGFKAELEGEFAASIVQLTGSSADAAAPAPVSPAADSASGAAVQ